MPPKKTAKQVKEAPARAVKRPVSPFETPTPDAKRVKLEAVQHTLPPAARRRPTRASKAALLRTIPEETESDEDEDMSQVVESQVDAVGPPDHDTIEDSDEEPKDFSHLIDVEAAESPAADRDDEAMEDNTIEWDVSGDEDTAPESPPNTAEDRRRILDQIIKGHPELLDYVIQKHERGVDRGTPVVSPKTDGVVRFPLRPSNTDNSSALQKKSRGAANPRESNAATRSTPAQAVDPCDGSVSVLNSALWPPCLKKMYLALTPPRRRVTYVSRAELAEPDTPSFQRWTACTHQFAFFKRVLQFESNESYFNLARGMVRDLRIVDTQNDTRPLRYFASADSNTPRLFISLVEIVLCNLVRAVKIARKNNDGWLDKKALIANWFSQEFELNVCNLGEVLDTYSVTLPCWSSRNELCGLTYQTRLANSDSPVATRGATKKSSLYAPGAAAMSRSKVPIQLYANQTVPVIDATVDGFDLSAPFAELKQFPSMQSDAPAGSIGCVFYTITDSGADTPLDFNIQALALLAKSPEHDRT